MAGKDSAPLLFLMWRYFSIFKSFLPPVQDLVADQVKLAKAAIDSLDAPKELGDMVKCDFEFYCKHQMPCSHSLFQHQLFATLKEEDFERWAFIWKESGFELYKGITSEVSMFIPLPLSSPVCTNFALCRRRTGESFVWLPD